MTPTLRNAAWNGINGGATNRLETLFDTVFGPNAAVPAPGTDRMPLAFWADADNLYLEAELAGVAEGDLDLTIHNGVLTIRAMRKPAEGVRYLFNSRAYGRFERVLELPEPVNAEGVEARFVDGVLSLRMPKTEAAKPRQIKIAGVSQPEAK